LLLYCKLTEARTAYIFAAQCYASAALAVMWSLCVCPSVHPSRLWILSKWMNISSRYFHCRAATPF